MWCVPSVFLWARPVGERLLQFGATRLVEVAQAIKPLIEKGFTETEIDTVQRLSVSTPVRHTGTKTFTISYRGKDATIRVELNKDDVDEIEIWFYTEPELAKEIRSKIMELDFDRDVH